MGLGASHSVIPNGGQLAMQVCSTAGINLIAQRRTKFSNLRTAISGSIQDLQLTKSSQDRLSKLLLAANLVKATCDAFISMAGDLGDAAGIKGVKEVSTAYSVSSKSAETAALVATGQKADWAGLGTTVAKAALPGETGNAQRDIMRDLGELQLIKVDMISSAINNNRADLLRHVFLAYIPKIAAMSLKALEHGTAEKFVTLGSSIANSAAGYSTGLEQAFDTRLSDLEDSAAQDRRIQRLKDELAAIVLQIDQMDALLAECGSTRLT